MMPCNNLIIFGIPSTLYNNPVVPLPNSILSIIFPLLSLIPYISQNLLKSYVTLYTKSNKLGQNNTSSSNNNIQSTLLLLSLLLCL